jgi:hypothetical protein
MTFIKGVNCDLKLFITKSVDMNACVLIKVNLDALLICTTSNVISKYALTSYSVIAVLFK